MAKRTRKKPFKGVSRDWFLEHSSKAVYHPRVDGSLKQAVAEAAERSLDYCVATTVYPLVNTYQKGRAAAYIPKPKGCKTGYSSSGPGSVKQLEVKQRPPPQRLVRAKAGGRARITFKWSPR